MVDKKKWFSENVKDLNRALCYKQSKERRVNDYFKEYKRKGDLSFEERAKICA